MVYIHLLGLTKLGMLIASTPKMALKNPVLKPGRRHSTNQSMRKCKRGTYTSCKDSYTRLTPGFHVSGMLPVYVFVRVQECAEAVGSIP